MLTGSTPMGLKTRVRHEHGYSSGPDLAQHISRLPQGNVQEHHNHKANDDRRRGDSPPF